MLTVTLASAMKEMLQQSINEGQTEYTFDKLYIANIEEKWIDKLIGNLFFKFNVII